MVVKPLSAQKYGYDVFESRVILDGSQTYQLFCLPAPQFESRVILDGSQTRP